MPLISFFRTAVFLAAVSCCAANAQTSVSPTTTKPAPPASAAVSTRVENWTEVQWEAAKIEWAKDAKKWANCQKQWNEQKHEGRKNWPPLYKCMTGSEG